jgi:hypothetical protein
VRELLTFLREESASARDHLRNQATEDRELLTNTIKIVAFPLTAVVAVVAFLGFKSLSDLKETIQREARNETKTEIARMHIETESQIKTMQSEIRQRLDQQFQAPNLRDIVKDAAREQTQNSARPLILGEVAKQVKSRVDAEQGSIRNAVTTQTQTAVKEMTPRIDKMVKDSVDSKVQTQVEPLQKQLNVVKRSTDIQGLISRMNADDALAFDSLAFSPLETWQPEDRPVVSAAVRSVFFAHNAGFFTTRSFEKPMSDERLITYLSDNDSANREAAVETLAGKKDLKLLTRIVQMMATDPSLNVRAAAHRLFNSWTGQKFNSLDKATTIKWWYEHQREILSAPETNPRP